MSVNRVVLTGRLTRDPELRQLTTGKAVVNFGIAVQKKFKPQDGSPDADFFNVSAWGKTAEFVSQYLNKGRLCAVDGRLQSRKYTTQDGQQREVVEIVADDVQGLDRPTETTQSGNQSQSDASNNSSDPDEYDPFADE